MKNTLYEYDAACEILQKNPIAVLATHASEAGALATPLHVVYDNEAVYWLSLDTAEHSRNISNGLIAMTIFSPQTSNGLEGVYLRGRATVYDDTKYVRNMFAERFGMVPPTLEKATAYRLPVGRYNQEKSFGNCWYFYS